MKLYLSPTSPYARIVLAVVDHHDLMGEIEIVSINPFEDRGQLQARNPLGKVPALELDDGVVVFDSPVIVDYLDEKGANASLFKRNDIAEYQLRTLYALSDGILDAAFLSVMELRRPSGEQSSMWLARWQENILAGVSVMADQVELLAGQRVMPHLSFAVTLDYLLFRLPHIIWQKGHSHLSTWAGHELQSEFYKRTDPRLAS